MHASSFFSLLGLKLMFVNCNWCASPVFQERCCTTPTPSLSRVPASTVWRL